MLGEAVLGEAVLGEAVLGEATAPLTRLVELPGRGLTRVWECAGPPGAPTLSASGLRPTTTVAPM